MEKKAFKLGIVPKLIIAILLGILNGQFLPVWFCRIIVTASGIFSTFLKFVIPLMILVYVTMGIAMVASPGAPGGSIMTALPFLYMIFGTVAGDPEVPICAIMVALYITQDSFGTACNISGDNAIGIIVDTIYKKFIMKTA